jgi:NADPH2:quinone reductase
MALPARMKVVEIAGFGGPDVLKPAERPVPVPGPGEILIKVNAAGVNRPDVSQRQGNYPPPPGASDLPGLEVAGTVAAMGPGVTGWSVGDRVCALTPGGGYAEYCLTPAPQVMPVPQGFSDAQAAAIPENWMTVWQNMVDRAGLKAGEKFLVHGGTSGIGTAAIQLAMLRGATVFATAGSADKCAFCETLGATRAANYKTGDFVAELKPLIGDGLNVVLDMVGGAYVAKNIALMAPDGRIAMIALLGGPMAEMPMGPFLFKRLTLTGSTLRPQPVAYKGQIAQALRDHVWPAFADGRAKVIIDSTFPLEQAAEAHRRLESSQHIGKIMLKVAG